MTAGEKPVQEVPLDLTKGGTLTLWISEPPSPTPSVHVHRWAWTITGRQECYDCGLVR
jgi:hypothetical protein